METMEPVEKGKISRRAVIVNGAVGAAAFWSVPVIESVTQRAAAASGCQPVATGPISYIWVIWTKGGVTYFSGYGPNAWNQGTLMLGGTSAPLCTSPCGPYCTNGFNGGAVNGDITGPGGNLTALSSSSTTEQFLQLNGVTVLTVSGGQIIPGTGVVIDAWFIFQAGSATAHCPSTPGIPPCGITIG
jgi:hypothetical protein